MLKVQSISLLVLVVLCMTAGQILFKYVAMQLRGVDLATAIGIKHAMTEPLLWTAIVLYGLTTVLWLLLLRGEDLSRIYPLVMAISLLLVTTAGVFMFNEHISPGGFIGAAVIFTGLCVLALFA
jgi:multidrug transporter EmrE-like cation transporter